MNANFIIEKEKMIKLKKILLDENKTVSLFLREAIDKKIEENERKGRQKQK
jgi:predicted DNA-binding protein